MGPKLIDWENRLGRVINSLIGQPYAWGSTDCVAIGLKAVDAMYGESMVIDWHDEKSARRKLATLDPMHWLKNQGAELLVDKVFATTGDIVTAWRPDVNLPSINVVVGNRCVSSDIDNGVHSVPAASIIGRNDVRVWRLP